MQFLIYSILWIQLKVRFNCRGTRWRSGLMTLKVLARNGRQVSGSSPASRVKQGELLFLPAASANSAVRKRKVSRQMSTLTPVRGKMLASNLQRRRDQLPVKARKSRSPEKGARSNGNPASSACQLSWPLQELEVWQTLVPKLERCNCLENRKGAVTAGSVMTVSSKKKKKKKDLTVPATQSFFQVVPFINVFTFKAF